MTAPQVHRPAVSVIVLTQDEEASLPGCLASLEGLDCEVFVVDSGSTDRTLDIARGAGATVVEHPFDNYAAQRNWAMHALPARGEWLLHLDADERLTPGLVTEMNEAVHGDQIVDGFLVCRQTVFMGRWIRHGGHYPSYHLRLFRRKAGFCERRLYDQHFVVRGRTAKLRNDFIDVTAGNLVAWTRRHARWAELEADEAAMSPGEGEDRVQPRLRGNAIQRRRWMRERLYARAPLFIRVVGYWLYRYVVRLGFLDGRPGLIFHFLQGCWYRFLVDAIVFARRRSAGVAARRDRSGAPR